jgi:hypothetical protein
MKTPSDDILLSFRDFIGDALSDPDITATDIIDAIRDELLELQDFHKIQGAKVSNLLNSLNAPEDVQDFADYLSNQKINEMDIASDLDRAINSFKGKNVWDNKGKRYRKLGE